MLKKCIRFETHCPHTLSGLSIGYFFCLSLPLPPSFPPPPPPLLNTLLLLPLSPNTLPQGIGPALTLLKEGLISGSPDEKEEAARVLVDVIHLAAPKTLSTGKVVMFIAGPLIRVLGDRYSWNVKVATLEALVELVRKVGVAVQQL